MKLFFINLHKPLATTAKLLGILLGLMVTMTPSAFADQKPHGAYVYTELQISVPFAQVPWEKINANIRLQPGFINKTWLSGTSNQSAGGFYTFQTIADAQRFVTEYFPAEAAGFGVAQTTRIFDATATAAASIDMNSVFYGSPGSKTPGAFVYTEVQVHATPFNSIVAWHERNPAIKRQPGLLSKTWLSGLNTGTVGGFYAFDTVENAKTFATELFPKMAKTMNAAFYTRVFDANTTVAASKSMASPFYR